MIFFLSKKGDAHLQYDYIIRGKFQIGSSETVEGVDYTNLTFCIGRFSKISNFEMAKILSNMTFFVPKKAGAHLQNAYNICGKFQISCSKLWKELIIQFF